ncbi:MAG: hypothetical protein R3B09_26865 [Nannocystaceae bacterium]
MTSPLPRWALAGICAIVVALSPTAVLAADVECTSLPNPLIGVGGSASKPLLAKIAPTLRTIAEPITLIYQAPGACFGITTFVDGTLATGTASYWEADGTEATCTFPVIGAQPDFGMLGVQATLCAGVDAIPPGIGERLGPITSWSLIVANASSQTSISAEALYFIYGFGAALGQVSPWIVDAELYSRNATSAALIAIALAIGVPPTKFKGTDVGSNQAMISSLSMSVNPEAALGFTSTEVADLNRGSVRTLAFQAQDQSCAYWPDSTSTAFDKRNVRDGHYFLWSAYRFYAPVDEGGEFVDPETRRFIGYFTGDEPLPPELPLLDIVIDNGTIPACAMTVGRDEEIGPLYSLQPEEPCGCYYEARAAGSTTCQACAGDGECPAEASTCRLGYCEST